MESFESPINLCRSDIINNQQCFLKPPLYAHATEASNIPSILKNGLLVQPIEKRVHTKLHEAMKKMCEENGVLDKTCMARAKNIYFYPDFKDAINQTMYMASLPFLDYKSPAIIIANLHNKHVYPDPEILITTEVTIEDRDKSIEELIRKYPNESIAVTAEGNVPKEQIVHVCRLNPEFEESFIAPIDLEYFYSSPEDFGFKEDPALWDKYIENKDYESYKEALENAKHEYFDKISDENENKPNFGKYYKHIRDYSLTKSLLKNFEEEIADLNNWVCTDVKNYE